MNDSSDDNRPWYKQVTRYQWLVLLIASLGWVFDIFEGQIFVTSMREAMPSLLPAGTSQGTVSYYNNWAMGAFLLGGAFGGVLFGMLSDRIGRTKTMIITILMYSLFTSVTAFAQTPWQMIGLRFFVAMGVGGEWAVASAMVAEVFPNIARARSLGIFHATSVLGSYLAIAAGTFIVGNQSLQASGLNWRIGFLVGALPALLTIWIRWRLREPEKWKEARAAADRDQSKQTGRIAELFAPEFRRRTLVGVSLAMVGLATFWGVRIYGKDLMRATAERPFVAVLPAALVEEGKPNPVVLRGDIDGMLKAQGDDDLAQNLTNLEEVAAAISPSFQVSGSADEREDALSSVFTEEFSKIKQREMLGHFLVITGGLPGLLAFGPLSERFGRRATFLFFCLGGFASSVVLFGVLNEPGVPVLLVALPIFGCLTIGMHAGYAVYFPELFPTRLRGTGGGFCFNMGRLLAAPTLVITGWLQKDLAFTLEQSATILSFLFLLGVVVLAFAPETKGRELPE